MTDTPDTLDPDPMPGPSRRGIRATWASIDRRWKVAIAVGAVATAWPLGHIGRR